MKVLTGLMLICAALMLILGVGCDADSSEGNQSLEPQHFDGIIVQKSADSSVWVYSETALSSPSLLSLIIDEDTVNGVDGFELYQSVSISYTEPMMESYPPLIRVDEITLNAPADEPDIEKAAAFYEEFLRKQESEISAILNED